MLVLGSQRFSGELEGQKINSGKIFTLSDSLNDADHYGHTVGSFSVGYDKVADYAIVPAYYDVEISIVGSKMVVTGCKRVSEKHDLFSVK